MICITRLNSQPMVLNSDLIEFIENTPDTVITLITGNKLVVLESAEQVISRIIDYRKRIGGGPRIVVPARTEPQEESAIEDE